MGSGCSTVRVSPEGDPGSAWTQWEDGDGNIYYYNFRSGNYTYEPKECDWYEMVDDDGESYWMNMVTSETSWNGPCQPPEAFALQQVMENLVGQMHVALPMPQGAGAAAPAPAPMAAAPAPMAAAPMATAIAVEVGMLEQALV